MWFVRKHLVKGFALGRCHELMAWTLPTALFFVTIGMALVVMTLLELRYPTLQRQGFLPCRRPGVIGFLSAY